MLKELNKRWHSAQRQAAAWKRWARKRPHNRVRRKVIRDERGRRTGYGPPTSISEPALDPLFCAKVEFPSGRFEAILSDHGVATAYRQARQPKPTQEEVVPLLITEEEIRKVSVT